MFIRTALLAATSAVMMIAMPASAAMYEAFSHYDAELNRTSSMTFSNYLNGRVNRLQGVTGKANRHFLFDKSRARYGRFETTGDIATLTGTLLNRSGEGFEMNITYERVADPGVYRNKDGVSQSDWSYYRMTSGLLTSLTRGLKSFELRNAGRIWDGTENRPLATQVGTGANDRETNNPGLLTEFSAIEQGCTGRDCERYKGSIRLALDQVERWHNYSQICICAVITTPERVPVTPVENTPAVVPLPASAPLLLGAFGLIGGLARKRRTS